MLGDIAFPKTPNDLGVNYEKMLKMIRKRRITFGSFAKKIGLSEADIYAIRIGNFMSLESEYRASVFLGCTITDLRTVKKPDNWKDLMKEEYLRDVAIWDSDSPDDDEEDVQEEDYEPYV